MKKGFTISNRKTFFHVNSFYELAYTLIDHFEIIGLIANKSLTRPTSTPNQTLRLCVSGFSISANTCIDRGAIDDTKIADNVIIDNL